MTKELTIIARIEAKKDKIEFVKKELLKLIEPTRKEEGCLYYNINQDNENPELFLAYESWQNQEKCQNHLQSDHFKVCMQTTYGAIKDLTVNGMSQIAK